MMLTKKKGAKTNDFLFIYLFKLGNKNDKIHDYLKKAYGSKALSKMAVEYWMH